MRNCAPVAALLCAAALAGVAQAADNQLTAQEKAAGWRLLFDGKTFANWVDPTKKSPPGDSFIIEDGCLAATDHPKIVEDLFTTETFRDFELEFDWKISPRGNSGVKYRIQDHQFLLDERRGGRFEDRANASMRNRRTDRPAKGQDYVIGSLTIAIGAPGPLAITTSSLLDGTVDTPYNAMVVAVGGTPPYTWSIATGGLPATMSLNASTGAIRGTPSSTGTTYFTVMVTDSSSTPEIQSQELSITVDNAAEACASSGQQRGPQRALCLQPERV